MSTLPLGAVSLDSLLTPGATLTVGDVTFSDFSFSASCANGSDTSCASLVSDGDITGILSETDAGSLSITPDTNNGMDGFTIGGSLKVNEAGGNATTLDITLDYTATITGSSNLLDDMYLATTTALNPPCTAGSSSCPSNPSVTIEESVTNGASPYNELAYLQVNDPPPSLTDMVNFSSDVSSVSVVKDIDLDSGNGTAGDPATPDYASATSIVQQLSQVPEPRAYALALGLFFALLVVIKRRRQQVA